MARLSFFIALLAATPAMASVSFSSTVVHERAIGDAAVPYRHGRLFSEDGRTFRLRVFGCEFDLRPALQGSPEARAIAMTARGAERAKAVIDYGVEVVDGRPAASGAFRPAGFGCATASGRARVLVFSTMEGTLLAQLTDFDRRNIDQSHKVYSLGMRQDMLTPQSERVLWSSAGSVGMALAQAWLKGR